MGRTTAERPGERLVSFLAELPEDERTLLIAVLADAGDDDEVSSYDAQTLWSSLPGAAPEGSGSNASPGTMLSNLANMRHEMLKTVANNLRA